MKSILRYLISAAAFIAIFGSAFADDDLIVMDRAYYAQCRMSFFASLSALDQSLDTSYQALTASLVQLCDKCWYTYYWASMVRDNSTALRTRVANDVNVPDYVKADLNNLVTYSENAADQSFAAYNLAGSITNQVKSDYETLKYQISSVSNSFPVEVYGTNLTLNVYVIVTNNFDFATNQLEQAQNSYTNFLNYYRGIEDQILDQYRASVTNLLDASHLMDWINSSHWRETFSGYHDAYRYINYDFFEGSTLPVDSIFYRPLGDGVPVSRSYYWFNRYYQLPQDPTFQDFFVFSFQGVHDAVQQSARLDTQLYNVFLQASTNSAFSYAFESSRTNAVVNFFKAPDTYDAQVHKNTQSRNWLQRLELWLSSIAKNTYQPPEEKTMVPEELQQEREQEIEGVRTTVTNQFAEIQDQLDQAADSTTNVFSVAGLVVRDFTNCLHHFSAKSNTRAGGSGVSDRFKKVGLMETSWISSRLLQLTNKSNTVPDYLVIQDFNHGNDYVQVWSLTLKVVDIVHNVFGIIWVMIGFSLAIVVCIHLARTFILIWLWLLKFIPDISRYTLGS